jgi:uracil-DNA glycosylase
MPSQYQLHVARWHDCERCELFKLRTKVVLCRGKVPCDILLVGEASGASEDVLGQPFRGPAGQLLDKIVAQAIPSIWRVAFTNIVACIPLNDESNKLGEPPEFAIKACAPRLKEFVEIAQPELLVCVGKLSSKHLSTSIEDFDGNYKYVEIIHPAAVLRADITQRGLMVQRAIVTLRDAVSELVPF